MTTPNTTPTPNNMPGAQSGNPPGPQSVSTEPPAPQQQAPQPVTPPATEAQPPNPPAPQPNSEQQPPATDDKQPMTLEAWREIARKNEARAKENEEKARKWEEEQAAKRTKEENDRIALEQERTARIKAETDLARERVSRETGVIPELLSGTTEDEMRAAATRALEWRGPATPATPPPPATAAVPASEVTSSDKLGHAPNQVQQLTKEQFAALSPAERMTAVRAGQCVQIGIGQPKPQRRMGNQLELAATASGTPAPGLPRQ